MPDILPNTDRGLLTADNCALVFIDHQPQMYFGVGSGIDRQLLINNVLMLAKGAKLFGVPTILTTVESESFSGAMLPQLLDLFPEQQRIERTGMNSWDTPAFREAMPIEALASQGKQQRTSDVRMRTKRIHHPFSVGVGVASSKTDQMNWLAPKSVYNLTSHVVSALHQVGDNDAVSDSFSSVRAKKALQCEGIT